MAVDIALAGRRFPVSVGRQSGFVLLPLANTDRKLQSEDRVNWPSFAARIGPPDPNAQRAHVSGGVTVLPGISQLNVDALCFELTCDDEVMEEFEAPNPTVRALSDWLTVFRSWIAPWTRIPQLEEVRRNHPFTIILHERDGQVVPNYFDGLSETAYLGGRLVDEEMFAAAAAAASIGRGIPEDHRMIARAQRMLGMGDFRASIIDSCSAAEISLSHWIRKEFEHRYEDPKVASQLLSRTNGIANLFKIYFAAHDSNLAFQQIQRDLAWPRNQAVHEGIPSEQAKAQIALSIATALINELAPIPLPSYFLRLLETEAE